MEIEQWKTSGKYFQFGDHRVFYQEAGSNEALLLIHGFPTASWDWYKLWPELSNRFRVIALDLVGFGFSDKPWPHRYSFREQAQMISDLMASLGLDRAHILAHDYGDSVAQELLALQQAQHPGLFEIRSVCFLTAACSWKLPNPTARNDCYLRH